MLFRRTRSAQRDRCIASVCLRMRARLRAAGLFVFAASKRCILVLCSGTLPGNSQAPSADRQPPPPGAYTRMLRENKARVLSRISCFPFVPFAFPPPARCSRDANHLRSDRPELARILASSPSVYRGLDESIAVFFEREPFQGAR